MELTYGAHFRSKGKRGEREIVALGSYDWPSGVCEADVPAAISSGIFR
jgi:hypothetical protein